ncbi:MAG: CTP synthase [Candidatus Heimdallarchaeota archaeon]|nr:MAG: CTP synthase [Candidatus Heimdallarchaeota archaeon]
MAQPKYIIVTGGVMSGLGKGLLAASLAKLLSASGYSVAPIKFDGYLNVDAGTINPYKHGEVYVLEDGTETDMDLGTYERFLNMSLDSWSSLTGGQIFQNIIEKERRGEFLGEDIQFIPHVTNEITSWIRQKDKIVDITLIEVGGTVGDIENAYFIEALRQLALTCDRSDVCWIHVTLIPVLEVVGEQKTKPTQASVKTLQGMGIQPDILLCRSEKPLDSKTRQKVAMFCNIAVSDVISGYDTPLIYEYPFQLLEEGILNSIFNKLKIGPKSVLTLSNWRQLVDKIKDPVGEVTIGVGGKYTNLKDAYVSITKALTHAGAHTSVNINSIFIETSESIEDLNEKINLCDGIIVPGGFGYRGVEGKIALIKQIREENIPFLGICLGLQCAVIEFARNVCSLGNANSTEFNPNTPHPVIDLLPSQRTVYRKGGTMRLGAYPVLISEGTLAYTVYGKNEIKERFRHRYEINPDYTSQLLTNGFEFSGLSTDGSVVHIGELKNHQFFIGTQFHPEFSSRFEQPNPLFVGFVQKSLEYKKEKKKKEPDPKK